MKKLILMVSLIAPVHVFANSCMGYDYNDDDYMRTDYIAVKYMVWNQSEYEIALKFDKAAHGDNPDYDLLHSSLPIDVFGCSHGLFTGYETKATLVMFDLKSGSYIDLGYLHIDDPFAGDGFLSYKSQNIYPPQCSCQVRVATNAEKFDPHGRDYSDCSDYEGAMKKRVEIRIGCQ